MRTSNHRPPPSRRGVTTLAEGTVAPKWAWHYRTLMALRDHFARTTGDRARESCDAMEPPSLHAEDLIDELYDRDLALALPPIPVEALREVEAALHRLKEGTYGKCEVTGRRIPAAELRAMPWRRCASRAAPKPGVPETPRTKHS